MALNILVAVFLGVNDTPSGNPVTMEVGSN